jgi:hypothetical protein
MPTEIVLSDCVTAIFILISIFGVGMAFKSTAVDDPKKRRRWFWALAILGILGFLANHFDKVANASAQAVLQTKLDTSIGNEGRMEGKLGVIGDVVGKLNCPGAKEIAAVIRQNSTPTSTPPVSGQPQIVNEPKLSDLSNNHLVSLARDVAQRMSVAWNEFNRDDDTANGARAQAEMQPEASRAAALAQAAALKDTVRTTYSNRCKSLVVEANDLQTVLLQKLGQDPGKLLTCTSEGASSLVLLANRLP